MFMGLEYHLSLTEVRVIRSPKPPHPLPLQGDVLYQEDVCDRDSVFPVKSVSLQECACTWSHD